MLEQPVLLPRGPLQMACGPHVGQVIPQRAQADHHRRHQKHLPRQPRHVHQTAQHRDGVEQDRGKTHEELRHLTAVIRQRRLHPAAAHALQAPVVRRNHPPRHKGAQTGMRLLIQPLEQDRRHDLAAHHRQRAPGKAPAQTAVVGCWRRQCLVDLRQHQHPAHPMYHAGQRGRHHQQA